MIDTNDYQELVNKNTCEYRGYTIRFSTIYKGDEIIMLYPASLLPTEKDIEYAKQLIDELIGENNNAHR